MFGLSCRCLQPTLSSCPLACRSFSTMATGTTVLPITTTPGPWRRLRTKTARPPQCSLLAPVQLGGDAPTEQQRQVYLVTLPFPRQHRTGLSRPRAIAPVAPRVLCFALHWCAPQSVLCSRCPYTQLPFLVLRQLVVPLERIANNNDLPERYAPECALFVLWVLCPEKRVLCRALRCSHRGGVGCELELGQGCGYRKVEGRLCPPRVCQPMAGPWQY